MNNPAAIAFKKLFGENFKVNDPDYNGMKSSYGYVPSCSIFDYEFKIVTHTEEKYIDYCYFHKTKNYKFIYKNIDKFKAGKFHYYIRFNDLIDILTPMLNEALKTS